MKYLIALDPGKVTGYVYCRYSDDLPLERIDARIVQGGYHGFIRFWDQMPPVVDDTVVCESFILRSQAFVPPLEAVEIIGALKYDAYLDEYEDRLIFQSRGAKHFSAKKDTKVADNLLKAHGLWLTGKPLGHTDGRDANDAMIHALAYMRNIGHQPTIDKYFS